MMKKDLMNGDIIVTRGGYLGVVIADAERIFYQSIGSDDLLMFNEDLTYNDTNAEDDDIMEVYRGEDFLEIENEEGWAIYQRDPQWKRPTKEEMEKRSKEREEKRLQYIEEMTLASLEQNNAEKIEIVTQCFYGNRTGTKIHRENINGFLRGYLSPEYFHDEESVDRKFIRVPNVEHIVIVYDQTQEDEYVNIKFPTLYEEEGDDYKNRWGEELTMQVTCKIPEIDLELHTKCFACRIDETGEFQSIQDEDIEKFIHYFPIK